MKQRLKKYTAAIFVAAVSIILAACGKEAVTFELSGLPVETIHTEKQTEALDAGYKEFLKHAFGTKEWSKPDPVILKWNVSESREEITGKYTVTLWDKGENEEPFTVLTEETEWTLNNPEIGKTYYWTVSVETVSGKTFTSEKKSFAIDDTAPRNLNVDGVTNVRDLGGWKTATGKVKQGMVFRSARLNDNGKETVTITEAGIHTMKDELGVKTELDLREGEIRNSSALGEEVRYVNIPIPGTITTQLRMHDESVKKIMGLFADENSYPILVHCSVGTDRTGLVCFLINGLLGVSEDDLYTDYAFSNFGKIGSLRKYEEIQESYVSLIKQFPGNTLSEKIEAYLTETGVTKEEIGNIKRLLMQ